MPPLSVPARNYTPNDLFFLKLLAVRAHRVQRFRAKLSSLRRQPQRRCSAHNASAFPQPSQKLLQFWNDSAEEAFQGTDSPYFSFSSRSPTNASGSNANASRLQLTNRCKIARDHPSPRISRRTAPFACGLACNEILPHLTKNKTLTTL